jgi:hypothetical protein
MTPKRRAQHRKGTKRHYQKNKVRLRLKQINYYAKRKKEIGTIANWVAECYGGTPCMDCGGVFPWVAMDFDHRPSETKRWPVSDEGCRLATKGMKVKVLEEIAKCEIVCSNCHRVRTQERGR